MKTRLFPLLLSICLSAGSVSAQDKRTQYPRFLANTYFTLNVGYINYPFSKEQLEPGFSAESVRIPHAGVSLAVLCHRFNPSISGQLIYMRPVEWVKYNNVNGDHSFHSIFLNILGATVKGVLPVHKKLSVYGEAGPGLFTRIAAIKEDTVIVKGASYLTLLAGAGLEYTLDAKWKIRAGVFYVPAHHSVRQPATTYISGGLTYTMHPLPAEKVTRNLNSGYIFPRHLLQVGYTSNLTGYGVNRFFAEGAVPVFWSGDVRISEGIALQYQRNIFHGYKIFSFDWGTSISFWKSKDYRERFFTLAVFPLFRFTIIRLKPFDFYFDYSAPGPAYISKVTIDGRNTGKHFTFQDFMGIGVFAGKKRSINAEVKIQHYSNGNIFTANPGLQIPLSLNAGYTF